jgi:hypothetical protein
MSWRARRLTAPRADEAFARQSLEREIDATNRYLTARVLRERFADGYSVGFIAESDEGQQDLQLEAAQNVAFRHILNNRE